MANQYLPLVAKSAARYRVPADLLAALLRQESGFQPGVSSGAGAQGIAQFMPGTWSGSWNPFRSQSPFNASAAIPAAALYLSRALATNKGNVSLALASYNAGQGAVNQYHGVPPYSETQNYVRTILAGRSQFPGLAHGQVPGAPPLPNTTLPTTTTAAPPVSDLPTTTTNPLYQRTLGLQDLIQSNARNAGIPTINLPLPAQTITQPTQAPDRPSSDANVQLTHPSAPAHAAVVAGPQAARVVSLAQQYLGTPYQWGGTTPKGFDCSGFAQFLYGKLGVTLPRVAADQFKVGKPVNLQQLQAGDLVFFRDSSGIHHEGIALGGGRFIHAPHTGDVVKISSLSDPYYARQFAGGRRVV